MLTSSSALLTLHVTLLEHHLQLQARLKVSSSAVTHFRNQFLEYRTTTAEQLSLSKAQLQELQAKSDQLAASVPQDDSVLKALISEIIEHHLTPYAKLANSAYLDPDRHLRRFIGQFLLLRPNLRPQNYHH